MPNRYTKLGADGQDLPDDATGHQAVRIDNPLLAAPLIVTAYRSPTRMTQKQAAEYVETLAINDWKWRLPSVEEAFMIPNRTRYPAFDTNFFPDCEGEWIRTSTLDAESPAVCAWVVDLNSGDSGIFLQGGDCFVRAVRSS